MTNYPIVSIIIPIYNASSHIIRCLNSVISQIYPNIEIILIDDGSSDNSPIICDDFAKEHSNTIVKHISNGGASLARKIGIDISHGEYLSFIDSDDYVAPNYISAMYEAIKKNDTVVSSCGVKIVRTNTHITFSKDVSNTTLKNESLFSRFFNYDFWGLPGALYHRSVFNDIVFPQATLSEDYLVKCQMFLKHPILSLIEEPLYVYEKHEGSLSNTSLSIRAFEEFENVKAVYDIIKKEKPEFELLAQKNVVETCIKLMMMGVRSKRKQYTSQYVPIKEFLVGHSREIWQNSNIPIKQRILAMALRTII